MGRLSRFLRCLTLTLAFAGAARAADGSAAFFFRTWHLYNAAPSTNMSSLRPGNDVLRAGPDSRDAATLTLSRDGTYVWGSHKGKWRTTGDGLDGYPIVLIKARDQENWRVGRGPDDTLVVTDGQSWFRAHR